MKINPHQEPQQEYKSSNSQKSTKPALIGFILIIFILGIFFLKNTWKQKNDADLKKEAEQESQVDAEDINVALMTPEQVYKAIGSEQYQLVDIRELVEFELKHIESSVNVPLSQIQEKISSFDREKIVAVIDREDSYEGKSLVEHLEKEGFNAKYLKGGILNYAKEGYSVVSAGNLLLISDSAKVKSMTAEEIKTEIKKGQFFAFLDVRARGVYEKDHIDGVINIPLEELEKRKNEVPLKKTLIYDDDPARSFQAASRLYDMNILNTVNCLDDYATLKEVLFGIKKEDKKQTGE